MGKKEDNWKYLIVLSFLGILLAIYLFINYLTKPLVESCYINSMVNCDAVTKGSLSTILGIPVSLIGLTGYVIILFSSIFKKRKIVLGMSSFGMLFCLYITLQEVIFLKVICPVCLLCQLVMLIVFIISVNINLHLKKTNKRP